MCLYYLSSSVFAIYEYMVYINSWSKKPYIIPQLQFVNTEQIDNLSISYVMEFWLEETKYIVSYDSEACRKQHKCISHDVSMPPNWSTS